MMLRKRRIITVLKSLAEYSEDFIISKYRMRLLSTRLHSSVSFLDFSAHRNILFESKDMTKVSVETVYSTAQDNVEIFAKQHILIYKSSLYFTYGPTTTESDLEFSHCVNLKDVVFFYKREHMSGLRFKQKCSIYDTIAHKRIEFFFPDDHENFEQFVKRKL